LATKGQQLHSMFMGLREDIHRRTWRKKSADNPHDTTEISRVLQIK